MVRIRLYVGLAITALLAVFALQNMDVVRIRFLLWEWYGSLALLIFVLLAAGLLCGWLISGIGRMSRPR